MAKLITKNLKNELAKSINNHLFIGMQALLFGMIDGNTKITLIYDSNSHCFAKTG